MTGQGPNKSCCAPSRNGAPAEADAVAGSEAIAPKRITIPGGSGLIGTNKPELAIDGEAPLRKSRVKAFEIEPTVVTNARFAKFVDQTGFVTEAEKFGNSFVFIGLLPQDAAPSQAVGEAPWWRMVEGANWRAPTGPGSEGTWLPDHPVVHVTWNDARQFAKWAGGRLPTEAEWEHAARGGLGDVRFPWGDREPNDHDFFPCNIWQGKFPDINLQRDGYMATAPAQSFEPNGYGLYNMVGNVWEYTSQAFKVSSLKKNVIRAHAGKTGFKLAKGGSFLCHASYCYRYRIAARTGSSPDSSTSHQGIRLVFDL